MRFLDKLLILLVLLVGQINANDAEIKKRTPNKNPTIESNTTKLDLLSSACIDFLSKSNDEAAKNIGTSFADTGITIEKVIETLEYINQIHQEDNANILIGKKQIDGSPWVYRMSKYWFVSHNFDFYRVSGNLASARLNNIDLPYGKIKLTKYAVFEFEMSDKANKKNDTEVYNLPEWVNPNTGQMQYRLRYTKQQIFDGVYRNGGEAAGKAKPIGFTTKSNVELVMLQGTFIGSFADGSKKIFSIAGTNEFPFQLNEKQDKQKRYIYFKENDDFYGYGKVVNEKIKIQPGLTFAGDTAHFGIGKLMLMCYEDTVTKTFKAKIGILADTGSAFIDNSFHFDYLTGVYNSKKSFYKEADTIPHYCEMYILIKK